VWILYSINNKCQPKEKPIYPTGAIVEYMGCEMPTVRSATHLLIIPGAMDIISWMTE